MQIDDPNFGETFYTVVMKHNSEHMDDLKHAIRDEIDGLQSKGVFIVMKRSAFANGELKKN